MRLEKVRISLYLTLILQWAWQRRGKIKVAYNL